jgi:hypothetical protein
MNVDSAKEGGDKMRDAIQELLDFAKDWGLQLQVNYDTHWVGRHAHCIGIPTKRQLKRKIWRGFFWVMPQEDMLCFYAPANPTPEELTKTYHVDLENLDLGGSPDNATALRTKISQVDFDNPLHRRFIQYILNARAQHCGRQLKKTISGWTGGCV